MTSGGFHIRVYLSLGFDSRLIYAWFVFSGLNFRSFLQLNYCTNRSFHLRSSLQRICYSPIIAGRPLSCTVGRVRLCSAPIALPIASVLDEIMPLRNLVLAASVGVLIIMMAVTDTEHPPAAGTVLGMSTRTWDPEIFAVIVGAVLLLAAIKRVLRRYLRDLI